jgi:hypothetical protein
VTYQFAQAAVAATSRSARLFVSLQWLWCCNQQISSSICVPAVAVGLQPADQLVSLCPCSGCGAATSRSARLFVSLQWLWGCNQQISSSLCVPAVAVGLQPADQLFSLCPCSGCGAATSRSARLFVSLQWCHSLLGFVVKLRKEKLSLCLTN